MIIWLQKECAEIDEVDRSTSSKGSRKPFLKVKQVKKKSFQPQQANINDKHGLTITVPEQVLNRWQQYGQNILPKPPNEPSLVQIMYTTEEPPPLRSEFERAITILKKHKSPGIDGIPAELIKHSGQAVKQALYILICKIWEQCVWPTDWKTQEFVVLFKAGSTKECPNYRSIALISHASKILVIILITRMKNKNEEELPDEQAAYRKGRGTVDMLVTLQVLIEKVLTT